jgi:hypothetical protein
MGEANEAGDIDEYDRYLLSQLSYNSPFKDIFAILVIA